MLAGCSQGYVLGSRITGLYGAGWTTVFNAVIGLAQLGQKYRAQLLRRTGSGRVCDHAKATRHASCGARCQCQVRLFLYV